MVVFNFRDICKVRYVGTAEYNNYKPKFVDFRCQAAFKNKRQSTTSCVYLFIAEPVIY